MIIAKNVTDEAISLDDINIVVPPNESVNLSEGGTLYMLSESNKLVLNVAKGTIVINDGVDDLSASEGIQYIYGQLISPRDRSGKLRVHQTSRKHGTRICWTGLGDDPTDVASIGGGETFIMRHDTGDSEPLVKYIDFNMVENETWLHEGYLTWKDALMDYLTLSMVSRAPSWAPGSNTNFNLYGGYMIIPAAGDGTIDVQSDLTDPNAGLVYMPTGDLGEPPTAFWNADYNSSTKLYENITAAPYGNGRYNIFAAEITLAVFVREIPLLGSGFIALNSSDTDEIGHGMRLKMVADTNTDTFPDHDWSVACIMCLHRSKST